MAYSSYPSICQCLRIGYNSKSVFITAFKKITSQTPSAFIDS
ncbi:AraC family transcriptional regulator [Muriicola sp. Z0-33]|nr:AraC family transcriptional regulator [Muriicola sp. Z0-33]